MSTSSTPPRIWLFVVLLAVLLGGLFILWWGTRDRGDDVNAMDFAGGSPMSEGKTEASLLRTEAEQALENWVSQLSQPLSSQQLTILSQRNRRLQDADKLMNKGRYAEAASIYLQVKKEIVADSLAKEMVQKYQALLTEVQQELTRLQAFRSLFGSDFDRWLRSVDEAQRAWDNASPEKAISQLEDVRAEIAGAGTTPEEIISQMIKTIEEAYFARDASTAQVTLQRLAEFKNTYPQIKEWEKRVLNLSAITPIWQRYESAFANQKWEEAKTDLQAILGVDANYRPAQDALTELTKLLGEQETRALLQQVASLHEKGNWQDALPLLEQAKKTGYLPQEVVAWEKKILSLQKEQKIKALLDKAYAAYQAQDFVSAKNTYSEALSLDEKNAEAKEGYENSAVLAIASVKFKTGLASAQKFADQGRYPMAISFFNKAMASKPQRLELDSAAKALEAELLKHSKPVTITLESDDKSYVSIVGVFPPEQFRKKTIELLPDVYTIYAQRKGYREKREEIKIKHGGRTTIELSCTEKL